MSAAAHHATWKLFIDGASRGNPGPSGAGMHIITNEGEVLDHAVYLGKKTNNQAEYLALMLGIYYIAEAFTKRKTRYDLLITSDSELLVKQMQGHYKVKNYTLRLLQECIIDLLKKHDMSYRFRHVLRAENKRADKLANEAIDSKAPMPLDCIEYLQRRDIDI